MATKPVSIDIWIRRELKAHLPRSKSLIVTIFGDSILPYSTGVWLSELIALLQPFHVNERLARTSAFRLAEEGWLESQREGRRSRYAMTPSGVHRVEHASHRIYAPAPSAWDGSWTIVIQDRIGYPAAERAEFRRELEWEGFGTLGTGIFIHPCADLIALNEILQRLEFAEDVVVLQARDLKNISSCAASRLAAKCWAPDSLALQYKQFLDRFEPALPLLSKATPPATAFVVQTLLIHNFRRLTLHDPRLPAVLLPGEWPGTRAFELCRKIYRLTFAPARLHIAQHLQASSNGKESNGKESNGKEPGGNQRAPLTPPPEFVARFGGLLG